MENGKTRHRFRTLALAMAMLTLAGGQWSASADENTPTLMFGAYVAARNGLSIQASVQAMEARLGRPLAAVRVFDVWDQPFPSSYDLWLRDTGHTLFFSVDAVRTNKVRIPWRSLADSQPGSALYNEIVGWANRIKAFGAHIYFTFNHEPEEKAGTVAGTAADFIDAWRKIVTVFRAQGVTNAEYTWIMTDYAFWRTDGGRASLWYPGDAYVDNIASDAYNWYNCRPGINNQWRSLSWIAGWMRDFGAAHPDKGLFLTEFASHEDTSTPGRKASWINDVQQLFKQPGWEQFQGILYYHQSHKPTCLFWLDSSTTSMAAITALANDPFFGRYEVGSDAPPTAPGKAGGEQRRSWSGDPQLAGRDRRSCDHLALPHLPRPRDDTGRHDIELIDRHRFVHGRERAGGDTHVRGVGERWVERGSSERGLRRRLRCRSDGCASDRTGKAGGEQRRSWSGDPQLAGRDR